MSGAAAGRQALLQSAKHLLREKAVTRGVPALLRMNQPDGFDCPGCAWPEPGHASAFEFCENGAKAAAAETTSKRVDAVFFARHSLADLLTHDGYWLEGQGRLVEPMALVPGDTHFRPVSWDEAFRRLGAAYRGMDPRQAVFYTSGRASNEAAYLYQLWGRALGTNHFPDCSNLCHESSGVALGEAVGVGKGTVTLEDFEKAAAIFVIGQNPGTNHPRMLSALQAAAKRGCPIVVLNPLRERGLLDFIHPQDALAMTLNKPTRLATLYLQPKVGGDFAVLRGMAKVLFAREAAAPGTVLDASFLAEHTLGFEDYRASVEAESWEALEAESALTRTQMEAAAEVFAKAPASIACWAMGLTQQKYAVRTIRELVNLWLLRGQIGKPGAGLCPVRGHSNVQGDRTMGITENPKEPFLQALDAEFGILSPRWHGYDAVSAIEAMGRGEVRAFFCLGGNFAAATPDTGATEAALRKVPFQAHVATKLNRTHLVSGGETLLLPCLGRSEIDRRAEGPQKVTVEDSMSCVHASHGRLEPAGPKLLSEPAIVARAARAALPDSAIPWEAFAEDYREIRKRIEKTIPGFADFEARIASPGGFYLGNAARERRWNTASGKAEFQAGEMPRLEEPDGTLRLMTLRSHDQYNTTLYGLDDRYRGIHGERRVVFLHPEDIRAKGWSEGRRVRLVHVGADGVRREAPDFRVVEYDIPRGCAAAYFPETNVLFPLASVTEKSRTPTSKFLPVRVEG